MIALLPFLHSITSFLHCVKKNCTVLSESESSNFFMYVIIVVILCKLNTHPRRFVYMNAIAFKCIFSPYDEKSVS